MGNFSQCISPNKETIMCLENLERDITICERTWVYRMHQTRTLNGVLPRPGSVAPKMWELGAILPLLDLSFLTLILSYKTSEAPSVCLILSLRVVSPLSPYVFISSCTCTRTHTHTHTHTPQQCPVVTKSFPSSTQGLCSQDISGLSICILPGQSEGKNFSPNKQILVMG